MKRITMYLIGILASVLAFGSVAVAADFTLYGSIRSGIIHTKPDGGKGTWDIGSVDAGSNTDAVCLDRDTCGLAATPDVGGGDRLWSRIGVRVSHDLGNGMMSGAHLEKRLDGWRTRHQNVWLEGGVGRVTLGQQGSPYYGAVSWDGSNFTGGTWDPSPRRSGVSFKSNLGGPFNFGFMFSDDNSRPAAAINIASDDTTSVTRGHSSEDAIDRYELAATFDIGEFATLGLGYVGQDDDNPYSTGGTLGGAAGGFSWELGYQTTEDSHNVYGFHTGYGVGGGNLYLNYEDYNRDGDSTMDDRIVIVGYSYGLGPGTRVIGEHKNRKEGTNTTILALRVDF